MRVAAARCPFCGDEIEPAEVWNFAYVRSLFLIHFDGCRFAPSGLTNEQKVWLAERLFDAVANRYF